MGTVLDMDINLHEFIRFRVKSKQDSIDPKFETSNDLSGLKQLEYLQIRHMQLTANSFNGLNNLIKLQLIECYTFEERLCFDSHKSLQFLRIKELYFRIELKSRENLKVLIIEGRIDLFGNSKS